MSKILLILLFAPSIFRRPAGCVIPYEDKYNLETGACQVRPPGEAPLFCGQLEDAADADEAVLQAVWLFDLLEASAAARRKLEGPVAGAEAERFRQARPRISPSAENVRPD